MAGETTTETNDAAVTPERVELPASATVDEAVALMGDVLDDGADAPPVDPNTPAARKAQAAADAAEDGEPQPDADPEPDADPDPAVDPDAEPQPDPAVGADAPEFWSAEDRATWAKVPADVRPVLQKYEAQRSAFVNEQKREAAQARAAAQAEGAKFTEVLAKSAAYWQENLPKLNAALADKYAGIDWDDLSVNNPAEYQRLEHARRKDAAMVQDASRRAQVEIDAARQLEVGQQAQRLRDAKSAAHDALLKKYPTEFADAETIYNKKLGPYLVAQGIPVDRVNAISEAPILEITYKAFLYDEGQKAKQQASAALTGKPLVPARTQTTTAPATPTRVQPGPATRAANRSAEASRQVRQRLDRSGGTDINAAAELIRMNGL